MARGAAVPALKINHTEWQGQVTDLMAALGWQHLHVRASIGKGHRWQTTTNRTGWPDLFGWHPRHGFAGVELKIGDDVARPDQLEVLAELEAAGAATLVAYPEDFDTLFQLLHGHKLALETVTLTCVNRHDMKGRAAWARKKCPICTARLSVKA